MSKLGPHVILPSNASSAWAAKAAIVKGLDNTDVFEHAPDSAIRIFRHYFATQPLGNPTGVAQAIISALNNYRHPNLYVEIYNEAYQLASEIQEYCDFLDVVITNLHAAGLKTAAFCFSTNNPDYPTWAYCRSRKFCHTDIVALHEYWGNQGFTLDNALRHRMLWRTGDPRIVITECGRDAEEGGKAGWKISGVTSDAYTSELAAYATEIQKDAYVLGATVFTSGPTPDWQNFEVDSITASLMMKLYGANMTHTDQDFLSLQNRVSAMEQRVALFEKIIEDILQSKINGADGAMGVLTALKGSALDFTPVWPPTSSKT